MLICHSYKMLLILLMAMSLSCAEGALDRDDAEQEAAGSGVTTSGGATGSSEDEEGDTSSLSSLSLAAPENLNYSERGDSLTASPILTWDHNDDASSYEIRVDHLAGAIVEINSLHDDSAILIEQPRLTANVSVGFDRPILSDIFAPIAIASVSISKPVVTGNITVGRFNPF